AQAALSSAIRLTMPQPIQNFLIQILLLWTIILSILQAVFIILFFKAGHHGLQDELLLGKGQMLTFKTTEGKANKTIKWVAVNTVTGVVSDGGEALTIKRDGYYFLNLQVTLKTPLSSSSYQKSSPELTVCLKSKEKTILRGWINTNTNSTGLLGKVEVLPAGDTLEVTIDPPTTDIDESESLTHLDIIYMVKP
ncbi:hypothetical protein L3Q82_014102, partial [Scortum barcoo]